MKRFLFGFWCVLGMMPVQASDSKRELEYADEIARTLMAGQIVRLDSDGNPFLAIYTETDRIDHDGAAIIFHDRGGHPDQKPLIHALRTELAKHQWATLSLQMPLREPGVSSEDYYALFPEIVPRVKAAIDYLAPVYGGDIALIGYGLGGQMALYAQDRLPGQFKAVVAISLPVPQTDDPAAQTLELLDKIQRPVLDIYGGLDTPEVTDSALKRRLAARENAAFRQIKINDEGHQFRHDEGLLVKRIYSWLRRVRDTDQW